jgi:CRP-like cAMP-binding protein
VIYEISKDALAPLLEARPSMVEELSQSLASRQLAHRSLLDHRHDVEQGENRRSQRLTATIRRLFALH